MTPPRPSSSNAGVVLVTGGAGYIGSVLVRLLLRQGRRVRVLDNFTFGGETLLGLDHDPHFELICGDIRTGKHLDRALKGVESVVHLAAIVGDPACAKEPEKAVAINKLGSELLTARATKAGVRRFVFASTCSNYGKMAGDLEICDESSPLRPVSLYAELKVGFEDFLLKQNTEAFSAVCLRFATAYGLSPRPRFDLTVNEFTRDLFLRKGLEIYGEQFWRPYCHTYDLATACSLALMAPHEAVGGRAFNVGQTDENYSKKDLVDLILEELPDRRRLVSYVARQEDPRDYRVNCDLIRDTLGFLPKYRVRDGIQSIIAALKSGQIADPESPRYRNLQG